MPPPSPPHTTTNSIIIRRENSLKHIDSSVVLNYDDTKSIVKPEITKENRKFNKNIERCVAFGEKNEKTFNKNQTTTISYEKIRRHKKRYNSFFATV